MLGRLRNPGLQMAAGVVYVGIPDELVDMLAAMAAVVHQVAFPIQLYCLRKVTLDVVHVHRRGGAVQSGCPGQGVNKFVSHRLDHSSCVVTLLLRGQLVGIRCASPLFQLIP